MLQHPRRLFTSTVPLTPKRSGLYTVVVLGLMMAMHKGQEESDPTLESLRAGSMSVTIRKRADLR